MAQPGDHQTGTNSHATRPPEPRGRSSRSERLEVPRTVRVLDAWERVPVTGTKDQRTAQVGDRQSGRVSRWQLLEAGLTRHMINSMLGSGHLIPRLPGVYAVGHAAPTELARETEALLCSSLTTCLSHISAAIVWGLRPSHHRADAPVDILILGDTTVRHPGIRSHRTKHLDRKLVRISEVRDVLTRCGARRPGAHRLQQLLDERSGRSNALSRSYWERRLRDTLKLAGIPPDEMNTDLHGYIPDMMWRDAKLIVEVDGWDPHRRRSRFEGDRKRDSILAKHGWLTLRITPRRIRDEPYAVVAEIAMLLGRRLDALAA
jgi:very-short-patch-repair endonuclease